MNKQRNFDPWQQFVASGSIEDYLTYKQSVVGEGKADETFHQRPYHSGTTRGGERPTGNGSHS